jgi:hypothetical protein
MTEKEIEAYFVKRVELKKPGGRLSPLQEVFAEQMETARQHYAVLWSKEGVDSWAERIK